MRLYRKTKLPEHSNALSIHLILYKAALNVAWTTYLTDKFTKTGQNPSHLFSTVKMLPLLPTDTTSISPELCNTFLAFFEDKVSTIHNTLAYLSFTSLLGNRLRFHMDLLLSSIPECPVLILGDMNSHLVLVQWTFNLSHSFDRERVCSPSDHKTCKHLELLELIFTLNCHTDTYYSSVLLGSVIYTIQCLYLRKICYYSSYGLISAQS